MDTIRDSVSVRDFRPDYDFPHLASLCVAIENADQTGVENSEAALKAEHWKKRWILEASDTPDTIIGHGWVFEQSLVRTLLSVAIHPAWRRRGYGSTLLTHILTQAKKQGAKQYVCPIQHSNLGADKFLHRHGFTAVGHNRFFAVPAELALAEPSWPEGYTVRSYAEIQDLARLAEAHNRCYADMWGHFENTETITEERLAEWMKGYPDSFIPAGIFITFTSADEVAGLCYGRLVTDPSNGEEKGVIDSPGVVPEYRHLELQRPLILITMNWLRSVGVGAIELHTFGDFEAAVTIYQQLGFELKDHWIEYLKE